MKENRCPKCELLNLPSADFCLQCKTPLTDSSPQTNVNVSTPTADYSQSTADYSQPSYAPPSTPFGAADSFVQNSKIGQRTYFWYRVFCSVIIIPSIVIAIFGFLAILGSFGEKGQDATDAFAGGVFFILIGLPPTILYFFGVILPTKPFHWFYGIFLLVLGILSCGLAPAAIPLLIFWVKPETQGFFERK